MKMKGLIILIGVAFLFFAGCAGLSATEQRVLSGGALGAGSGALIGAAAGSAGIGAAVGGGVGLLAGYAYDRYQKTRETDSSNREAATAKKPRPNSNSKQKASKLPENVPSQGTSHPEEVPIQETSHTVPQVM
jgi:osmotically inducible lipoprotein OsmB